MADLSDVMTQETPETAPLPPVVVEAEEPAPEATAAEKMTVARPNTIVMLTRDEFKAFREGKVAVPPGVHVSSDQQTLKDFR